MWRADSVNYKALRFLFSKSEAGVSSTIAIFRDSTAGKETYGAGRFLEANLPKAGKLIVDFNKAYNPFCAFNPLCVCPIPHHLAMRIPAGERDYPHPGEAP